MKQCPVCGAWNPDQARFCSSCGAGFSAARQQTAYTNPNPQGQGDPDLSSGGPLLLQRRSVALCIVLTLITCGLYGLYWMYRLNNELNQTAGVWPYTSGGLVVILHLITCGIYGIYWNYRMGQNVSRLTGDNYSAIVFLVFSLFGFSIISMALMQDTLNRSL